MPVPATPAVTRAELGTLQRVLRAQVEPLPQAAAHHNQHFIAIRDDGTRLFVKLIVDAQAYYIAEVSVGDHLAGFSVSVPPMVDHGEIAPGRFWIAYAWRDIRPFAPDRNHIEAAGAALSELHTSTRGTTDERLRRYTSVSDLLTDKINIVSDLDPGLGDRLARLRSRIAASEAAFAELADTSCLLHGDFGWRNLGLDTNARPLMFDFEHAAIGPAILEFAKLWDRELWDTHARTAFFRGYQHHTPIDLGTWNTAIDAVRLWAAAGIFPYAWSRNDHAFEQHAHTILDRLAAVRS